MSVSVSNDIEFDSLCPTERSVARFLIKYRIGDSVPYRVIYQVDMSSPEWRERKAAYFSTHPKQCESCGSTDGVQLHHKSYAHFTQEPDEDLAAVCETCHQWIHLLHRSSPLNLAEATDAVIAAGRKQVPPDPNQWKRPAPGRQGTPMDRHFAARRAFRVTRLDRRSEARGFANLPRSFVPSSSSGANTWRRLTDRQGPIYKS
jgi:hypothetical protein